MMDISEANENWVADHWLLPADRPLCRFEECISRFARAGSPVHYLTDVRGCAGVAFAARLAEATAQTVLYVVPDSEVARAARADARFHWSRLGSPSEDSR